MILRILEYLRIETIWLCDCGIIIHRIFSSSLIVLRASQIVNRDVNRTFNAPSLNNRASVATL